jgi:uncharacterized membrane protein YfcA
VHLAKGTLVGDQWVKAVALGIGTVPGAQAGAQIARRMKARTIVRLLVAALLLLAGRLLVKGIVGA